MPCSRAPELQLPISRVERLLAGRQRGRALMLIALAFFWLSPASGLHLQTGPQAGSRPDGAEAAISVLVRNEAGEALPDLQVSVVPPREEGLWFAGRVARNGRSGADGRISFSGLPVGRYQIDVFGVDSLGLVASADNPYQPSPRVTLAAGERRTVEVVLWRGVEVAVEMRLEGWPDAVGGAVLEHRDSGQRVEFPVTSALGRGLRLLPRGRWSPFRLVQLASRSISIWSAVTSM